MRSLLIVTLWFGFLGAARSQSLLVEAGKETDVRIIKPSAKLKSWFSEDTQCTSNQACPSGAYCNAQYRKCMPCSTCQQNSDSIDGRCPQDKCSAVSTSQNDNLPPELVWLFIYPNSITITSGKVFVSAYMYTRDSGAGLRGAAMYVESSTMTGSSHAFYTQAFASQSLISGTPNGGVLNMSFWFQQGDEGGEWGITQLYLVDLQGNHRVYSSSDLLSFGAKVNSTILVSSSVYYDCSNATNINCFWQNAHCKNKLNAQQTNQFAVCECNQGYVGNAFACVKASGSSPSTPSPGITSTPPPPSSQGQISQSPGASVSSPAADTRLPPVAQPQYSQPAGNGPAQSEMSSRTSGGAFDFLNSSNIGFMIALIIVAVLLIFLYQKLPILRILLTRERRVLPQDQTHLRRSSSSSRLRQRNLELVSREAPRPSRRAISEQFIRNQFDFESMRREWSDFLGPPRRAISLPVSRPPLQPPTEPQPISLPQHLKLPGTVPRTEVEEGEECAVCMEMAKNAILFPCGHQDLCIGCAEHIKNNGGTCPVCRHKIQAVQQVKRR